MKQKLKADALVIGSVLLAAFLFFLVPYLKGMWESPAYVVISRDGIQKEKYSLWEDRTISVNDGNGGYNLIMINDGTVKVTDADCPDQLCVKQKQISQNGESIICLPHKLVVQIVSEEESDLDAVTN